jgi:hypothetical protein
MEEEEKAEEEKASPRADLLGGLFWLVIGAAIAAGAWRMDRLESQGATLYTAPGLVPGLLGASIAFLGVLLAFRSMASGALTTRLKTATEFNGRLWLSGGLMLAYAAVLVGHGVPFWLATWLFVSGYIAIFEWPTRTERGQRMRGLAMALLYGAGTSLVVSYVFQEIFYVRLP